MPASVFLTAKFKVHNPSKRNLCSKGVDFPVSWYFFNPPLVLRPLLSPRPRPVHVIKYGQDDEANVEEEL